MPLLTVLALMALPLVEIGLIVLVAGQIGVAWTIVALGALSLTGGWWCAEPDAAPTSTPSRRCAPGCRPALTWWTL